MVAMTTPLLAVLLGAWLPCWRHISWGSPWGHLWGWRCREVQHLVLESTYELQYLFKLPSELHLLLTFDRRHAHVYWSWSRRLSAAKFSCWCPFDLRSLHLHRHCPVCTVVAQNFHVRLHPLFHQLCILFVSSTYSDSAHRISSVQGDVKWRTLLDRQPRWWCMD